jgi:hypothetical protein
MPDTPLLGITEVSPTQTGKETTLNNAILALEGAGNATLAVSMVAGDVTLSVSQFTRNMVFNCTGLTAPRVLNLPALINATATSRVFAVRNSGAFAVTVQITGGGGTAVVLNPSETRLLDADGAGNIHVAAQPPSAFAIFSDATTARTLSAGDRDAYIRMTNASANAVTLPPNATVAIPVGTRVWVEQAGAGRTTIVAGVGVTLRQSSPTATLYCRAQYSQVWATKVGTDEWVLSGDFGGLLDYAVGGAATDNIQSNEILTDHPVIRAFTIPVNFAGSFASSGTNPAASFVLTVLKNGASIGTITIATSGTVTFATSGGLAQSFAAGDLLTVKAPATVDTAIARLRYTIKGNN